jgi:MFS family permease
MFYKRSRTVAGNTRALNLFSFWFCLRFYAAVTVIYFAHVTHSYLLAVSLLVLAQVTQAILEVPTGIASDRLGRVWCLRLGAVMGLLSVICYAVGGSYAWLALGAILEGFWQAMFSGNNEALLYESAKELGQLPDFHRYLGGMNVAMEISGFIAMIAGGLLASLSFQWALWLTAVAQLPTVVAGFWLVEPSKHVVRTQNTWLHFKEALNYMRRNPTLRRLSIQQIMGGGFSTFALWPAFYRQILPVWAVGLMMSANYLESAIGFRLSGWFLKHFRAITIIFASDIYSRLLMFPALLFPTVASPPLMALAGAPYGPATVAAGTIMHQEYTDHQRATMASINSLLTSCLYAGFGLLTGSLADRWGIGAAILLGQLCLLPALWLSSRMLRDHRS